MTFRNHSHVFLLSDSDSALLTFTAVIMLSFRAILSISHYFYRILFLHRSCFSIIVND